MLPTSPPCPTPSIVALVSDSLRTERLRAAFGTRLRAVESQPALIEASRNEATELVIVPWQHGEGHSLATTIATIRASRRSAPIYVYADRSTDCLRALMALARAGARGVIVRDVDDDVVSLHRLLDRGTLARGIESVTMVVLEVIPPRHVPLFTLCIEHVVEPLPAPEFARRLCVSRRTLTAWAQKAGAKGLRSLSSKCRVLVAIELLRDSGRTIEFVAHTMRFASSAHLHNTLTRHARMLPREAAAFDLRFWCRRLFFDSATPSAAGDLLRKSTRLPRNGSLHPAISDSPHATGLAPEELVQ